MIGLNDFLGLPVDDFHVRGLCSFGGGGGGTTTTTQNTAPWAGQQPYLTDVFNQASNLNKNTTQQYYPNSTYVGLTDPQLSQIQNMSNYGTSGGDTGLQAANANTAATLSPGYTNGTSGAFNGGEGLLSSMINGSYGNQASGAMGAGSNALSGIANGNYQSSASPNYNQAQGVLGNEMSAGYLNPQNSPAFQQTINNTLANVMPGIDASYVNGNRAGGGLAAAAAAQGATNAVGQLEQNQYNTNQQVQQQAAGLASQNNQNAASNAINAANGANSMYGTIGGLQQGAANTGTANYLTQQVNQVKQSALAPMIDQAQMGDLQSAYNAQSQVQNNAQQATTADVNKWNYNQMLPWNQLGLYDQFVQGNYGGSSTTTQPYYSNTGANILGGASSLMGIGGGIGSMLGGAGVSGAAGLSGLGALGGALMAL